MDRNEILREILKFIDSDRIPGRPYCTNTEKIVSQCRPLSSLSPDQVIEYVLQCADRGYFENFRELMGVPPRFLLMRISSAGYDFMERKESEFMESKTIFQFNGSIGPGATIGESINQNTTYGSTYGDNAHIDQSVTTNIGASLAEIKELISAKPAADQEQLQEILRLLTEISQNDEPIKKGLLAKFSDGLKKHSDILTAIGNWAVQIMMVSGQ